MTTFSSNVEKRNLISEGWSKIFHPAEQAPRRRNIVALRNLPNHINGPQLLAGIKNLYKIIVHSPTQYQNTALATSFTELALPIL